MRDHSWGPRYWQSIWWYRWLTGNLGRDLGFALTVSGSQDGGRRTHGFLYDRARYGNDQWVPIRQVDLTLRLRRATTSTTPCTPRCTPTTTRYEIEGMVWSNIPLRNRRQSPDGEMLTTRIAEGMTTWRYEDLVGSGLAEYLDQVVDGTPVGIADGAVTARRRCELGGHLAASGETSRPRSERWVRGSAAGSAQRRSTRHGARS